MKRNVAVWLACLALLTAQVAAEPAPQSSPHGDSPAVPSPAQPPPVDSPPAPLPAQPPPLDSPVAPSPAQPPHAVGCDVGLYAEPTMLAGVLGSGQTVVRVRLGLGVRLVSCLPADRAELRLGGYFESGSHGIGDTLSAGAGLEYSDVFGGRRYGATLHVDPAEVRTISLGARVHLHSFAFGVEGIYSGRGYKPGAIDKTQAAAVGVLATIGVTHKVGAYVTLAILGFLGIASLGRGNG